MVAATRVERQEKIFPFLINQLETCIPRDLPTHANNMLIAVNAAVKGEFYSTLVARQSSLTPPQQARLKKVLRMIEKME